MGIIFSSNKSKDKEFGQSMNNISKIKPKLKNICPPNTILKTGPTLGCVNILIPNVEEGADIILAATHNARLQCFINYLVYTLDSHKEQLLKNVKNKKFMNCAVIKCVVKNSMMRLYMIFQGVLDEHEKKDPKHYWTYEFNEVFSNISFNVSVNKNSIFEVFLIRHGQGFHNENKNKFDKMIAFANRKILNKESKYLDALLTDVGIKQAAEAADAIQKHIKDHKVSQLVASRLKRTWQTIAKVAMVMEINKPIHVIHCLHELAEANPKGECDANNNDISFYGAGENKGKCITDNFQFIDTDDCKTLKIENKNFTINWSHYDFKVQCKGKNIISIIIEALNKK
jgi:phosphohistidine phosphatase SixA